LKVKLEAVAVARTAEAAPAGGRRRGRTGGVIQNFGFKSSPDTLPADFAGSETRSPASYTTLFGSV